jgi:hypothetical protein
VDDGVVASTDEGYSTSEVDVEAAAEDWDKYGASDLEEGMT